jgi:hypothetical protein
MTLQHLRSSTANKRPLPAGMSDGQLAINTNTTSPGLFFKDSAGNLIKTGPVHIGTTAPNASPASGGATGNSTGELWLDTSLTPNELKTWNGSAWISATGQEIPVSKLIDGDARQLLQTDAAGTGVEWTSSVDVPGTLDVTGATTLDSTLTVPLGSAASPTLRFSGDANSGLYSPGADQVAISTNGTGRLFVDASGRVGIGSSSVDSGLKLQIVDGTASKLRLNVSGYAGLEIGHNADFTSEINQKSGQALLLKTSDTERLRITSAGLVGIGTSSPEGKLTVAGTAAEPPSSGTTANSLLQLKSDLVTELNIGLHTATGNYGAYIQASDNNLAVPYGLHLQPTGGNVGIGTTTLIERLHVNGSVRLDADNQGLFFNSSTTAIIGNGTSSYIAFNTSNAEKARLDSSGRLLVGTSSGRTVGFSSLQAPVQVETTTAAAYTAVNNTNDANGCYVSIAKTRGTSAGAVTAVQNNDELGAIRISGSDGTGFVVGAQIIAAVDGTPGTNDLPTRLTFSTTADGASSPTERMRIGNGGQSSYFTSSGAGNRIGHTAAAGTSSPLIQGGHSASDISNMTTSFYVWSNGNVENTNNSYGAISDIKLKENIVDANSQWDDLKALQVRNYNFKEGQTHTQIGLIAQEVELVSPGLVSESPDRDAEGNDLGTVTKSVNYSVLYMKAVKALQEAMERIETLEAKVAALESA